MRAHGNGLGRIDYRSPAHGEHPIDAVLLAKRHALAHKRYLGIGPHAPQFDALDAGIGKRRLHAVDEPAFNGTAAPVVQQHLAGTALGEHTPRLELGIASEYEMGRRYEFEIFHGFPSNTNVSGILP